MMLKRIVAWIKARRMRSLTPEDIAAQQEARRIEADLETTRVLGRTGPRGFTSDREWKGD
jgi:hypothetical protein